MITSHLMDTQPDFDYFFLNEDDELFAADVKDIMEALHSRDPESQELPEVLDRPVVRQRRVRPESRILEVHPGVYRIEHTSSLESAFKNSHFHPCSFVVIPITDYPVIRTDKRGYESKSNCIVVTPESELPPEVKQFFSVTDQILRSPF